MQPNNAEELVRDALRLVPWMLGYEEMEGCMIDWIEEQNEGNGNDKFVQQMLHLLSEGKIRPSKPHSRLPKLAEPFISERDQIALQTHWMQQSHQSVSSMCMTSCSELKHELADLVQRWLAQSALSTEAVAGALVSIMDDSISEPLFLRSSRMGGTPDIASSAANLQLFNKVKQGLVGFPLPSNLRRFVWKQALLKDPLLRSRLTDDLKRALADERSPRLPAAGGAAQRHTLESTSQQKVEHVLTCLKLLSINVTTRHTSIAAILCKVFDASEPAVAVEDLLAMLLQLTDVFLPSPLFRQAYNTMALASEAHQLLRAIAPEVADKLEATCARILEVQPSRRQQPTFMLMFNRWLEDAWVGYMPEELLLFLWDQCFLLEWHVMLPRLCAFLVIAMEKTSGGDHWENVPSHRPQQLVDYTLANSSAMMQEIRTLLQQSKT